MKRDETKKVHQGERIWVNCRRYNSKVRAAGSIIYVTTIENGMSNSFEQIAKYKMTIS